MTVIRKIVSGGQTGVDQAALQFGLDFNIEVGGWCPPGKVCEDGLIPEKYKLTETPKERSADAPDVPRSERTEFNVRDSDGTLILGLIDNDLGTQWTIKSALKYNKPYLILDFDSAKTLDTIKHWISENNIAVLNVAGPSEKTFPGVHQKTYLLFKNIF